MQYCLVDGPEILQRGPREITVRMGGLVVLTCVVRYRSNPAHPTVTWQDPQNNNITAHNERYNMVIDRDGIRLEFPQFSEADVGTYRCGLELEGTDVLLPNGSIAPRLQISPPLYFFIQLSDFFIRLPAHGE